MVSNRKLVCSCKRSKAGLLSSCAGFVVGFVLATSSVNAQQVGGIAGYLANQDGVETAGVTIEARSSVLPRPRTTTSAANGRYQLPLLPPGTYELTFTFPDGSTQVRTVFVQLQQRAQVDIVWGASAAADSYIEEISVEANRSTLSQGNGSLRNSIREGAIQGVPIGQQYRDIQKLIPGVQLSEDLIRGPSAGGSGQDNAYQFDGVDVTLPLFGTLSAEPSSHDIASVSIVRGGAQAIGFNRAGGFQMNTISKRGTDEFHGEVRYQIQTAGMTSQQKILQDGQEPPEEFDEDRSWLVASLGGPLLKERLFFYTSYFRPVRERDNSSNVYGEVPDFKSKRDEFFGKLTFSPTDNILLDASYRTSDRSVQNRSIGAFEAATASVGDEASLDIAIVEGSWVIDDASSLNVKYTNFRNDTSSRPDTLFDFEVREGDSLNIADLANQGFLFVPRPIDGEDEYNAFIQPIIDQYGFLDGGVPTGGGAVGGASSINDQDFTRESFEVAYDRTFYWGETTHDVHIGFQTQAVEEDLARTSNGWGTITVPGGRGDILATDGITPIFFNARINQMSLGGGVDVPPVINSRSELQSFEINDRIEYKDFTFNVGVLLSQDTYFGQGLREAEGTISGFELAPGNRYKMYEIDWLDMIQPRFGVTWDYSDKSALYANYARYHPSASSLARAASWDRNLRRDIDVAFDENGDFIEIDPVRASSGKFFQEDLSPRKIDEFLVGWRSDVTSELTLRAHVRHRRGRNFWEDTNNDARVTLEPPADIPRELYIPNLDAVRAEIGGSSFVIAQLDGAYTNYWEASLEAEYTADDYFVSASYVWSRYRGNFDQDNTTVTNDANTFIGSSFIADGAGRQLWNFRDGTLRGDRPHVFKAYGYYKLDWNAQVGAFVLFQSGQPWEAWDVEIYREFTRSTSDTSRFAEPAGSRRSSSHYQLDLNYTQNIKVFKGHYIQLRADLFNVFNKQTGYNIQNRVNSARFGTPRSFFLPRRLQLAVSYRF